MAEPKSILDNFTPKQAFVSGIILTVLTVGTLGFLYSLKYDLGLGQPKAPLALDQDPALAPTGGEEFVPADVRPVDKNDHVYGKQNAKITLVEYSDFECPFCGRHHPTLKQLVDNNDDIRWVYRHFPLTSLHPNAQTVAEASECAGEQGKFWEFADKIFETGQANLTAAQLSDLATAVGVKNKSKFDDCVSSGKYAAKVQADAMDGQAAGGTGTPFTVIVSGDQQIPVSGAVPLAQFQSIIDSLR